MALRMGKPAALFLWVMHHKFRSDGLVLIPIPRPLFASPRSSFAKRLFKLAPGLFTRSVVIMVRFLLRYTAHQLICMY